ncbi:MAG: hypothetical protein APF82_10210 [Sphingomonadales bacterium BRH_c42]|nr:MAG: hypothetical protein APF82_10210 [Sphingomonadales bacterium BRH_c42]
MREKERDQLVRSIYDAALDPAEWPTMLTRIASAMNCEQSNFAIIDPYSGVAQAITPKWREEDREAFFSHWQKDFSLAGRLEKFPVGQVLTYEDFFDVDWLKRTDFYNEWWLPMGVGGGSFAANVVSDGHATASITVHAPQSRLGFTSAEKKMFEGIVEHVSRSVMILRRLQLGRLATSHGDGGPGSGFAVVDRSGVVLHADGATLVRLNALGLLVADRAMGRIAPGPLKGLLHRAISLTDGGHIDLREGHGSPVRLTVIPCSPRTDYGPVVIDRPAALIWLISLEEVQREKMQRLVNAYSLTPAETRVAVEACAGGGRSEIAKRCGVSPSTIRTHLEAIFFKTGVHRQAELVHLVEAI